MAKKSQTNSRRNNTQAGRRVVNFYNNGTVNIDARQNRSHTHKTENNGCTINYPYHLIEDYFNLEDQISPEVSPRIVELPAHEEHKGTKTKSALLKIAAGIAIASVGMAIATVLIKSIH
jgi:hypothetical protein